MQIEVINPPFRLPIKMAIPNHKITSSLNERTLISLHIQSHRQLITTKEMQTHLT
jgi:hypothetical protein